MSTQVCQLTAFPKNIPVAQISYRLDPFKHKPTFTFEGKAGLARYVAYFRVSTEKQGKSGLGLAAQHSLVERFLSEGDELISEFVEVHSGKNDERVELWKAINHAKRNDAKLADRQARPLLP